MSQSYRKQRDPCEVCGVPAAAHPKCRACWIGAGPGHLEPRLDEDGLCGNCAWVAKKNLGKRDTRNTMSPLDMANGTPICRG